MVGVSGTNPWTRLSNADYERHMGHEKVGQLSVLSRITTDQLALVWDQTSPVVAILGITNGNGLEHVDASRYGSIIGLDISREFLDVCRERCSHLMPALQLHQIDLISDKRQAVELIRGADLVTANLLVEHIHLEAFVDIVRELERPVISVTIQVNRDGCLVSRSGYEDAFNEVVGQAEECNEDRLLRSMIGIGYGLIGRVEYPLPNGKLFVRLDLRRR